MQKTFWQNSLPFYGKNSPESGHRGNIFQHNNAMYYKPIVNITLNGKKLKPFPLRSGTKMSTLTTFIQRSFGSLSYSSQRRKRNESKLETKKYNCHCLQMILYIENPKDATRKRLKLINDFGKISGYKINTQKFVAFLYTNNERSEREIQEMIHLPSYQKQ